MARTAHHMSPGRRTPWGDRPAGEPWSFRVLYDLRHDAAGAAGAARASTRPRPRPVRRVVAVYRLPRHQQDKSVAHWSAREERRARRRLRADTGRLVGRVNTARGRLAPGAADTVEVLPVRHRHGALGWA